MDQQEFHDYIYGHDDYQFNLKVVNQVRKNIGVKQLEPKKVSCLKCETKFDSWDASNNRVCTSCKGTNRYIIENSINWYNNMDV